MFRLRQNEDGYVVLESLLNPKHYFGVRSNGNIMPMDKVDPNSMSAQFIIQKEAVDFL